MKRPEQPAPPTLRITARDLARIAKPTIAEVLAEFLADQRVRMGPKTFAECESVVEMFQDCLNGYGHQELGKAELRLFDRFFEAEGDSHREFCQVFGPEHILANLDQFLGWFMVRKVIAPKAILRAAGTVMKRLASWMGEKGYAKAEEAADSAERGAEAARDLPKAEALASRLHRFAEMQERGNEADEVEDHFTIVRVEPGAIWLDPMSEPKKVGPIRIPENISCLCRVGWEISGVVGRVCKEWRLLEAWNVYPQ